MVFFSSYSYHWGAAGVALTFIASVAFHKLGGRIDLEKFHLRRGNGNGGAITSPIDFGLKPVLDSDLDLEDEPSFHAGAEASVDDEIPECAQDVFLELREQGGDEDDGRGCRGMLVRDDVILTSKACSALDVSFQFPDEKVGRRRAIPLELKERGESLDPRLGFLKTNAPPHYHFVDQPVFRTRMFLSRESGGEGGAAIMTCDHGKPVAHNFPVGGELVPLGHLSDVVPDDILWKERDLATAPMLEDGAGGRWWTRFVTLQEEEKTLHKLMESFRGPPGSVSIPAAHKDTKPISQTGSLCEAIDPRHRKQDCFKNYYFRWRNAQPFGGEHFFDWLDFGPGRDLMERNVTEEMIIFKSSDLDCLRVDFDRKIVNYFSEEERREHEIYLTPSDDGRELVARYRQSDEEVRPSPPDDPHLYMWSLERKFYVVDDTFNTTHGKLKHTSVLAGRPGLSGGKVHFGEGGRLLGINYSSGHYRPKIVAPAMMHQWMKDRGLNTTAFSWIGRSHWTVEDCGWYDWEAVEIPGFEGKALNRSCHEVTTSPTWTQKEDDR